jgi:hypothetical protein
MRNETLVDVYIPCLVTENLKAVGDYACRKVISAFLRIAIATNELDEATPKVE